MSRRWLPARLRALIRRLPIHRKLSVIVAIAVAIGLVFVFVIVGLVQLQEQYASRVAKLHAVAEVVAFNASAVLEFQDPVGAGHLFRALEGDPAIVAAHLVQRDGPFRHTYVASGWSEPHAGQVAALLADVVHRHRAIAEDPVGHRQRVDAVVDQVVAATGGRPPTRPPTCPRRPPAWSSRCRGRSATNSST